MSKLINFSVVCDYTRILHIEFHEVFDGSGDANAWGYEDGSGEGNGHGEGYGNNVGGGATEEYWDSFRILSQLDGTP